jgi:hypothetical protein
MREYAPQRIECRADGGGESRSTAEALMFRNQNDAPGSPAIRAFTHPVVWEWGAEALNFYFDVLINFDYAEAV